MPASVGLAAVAGAREARSFLVECSGRGCGSQAGSHEQLLHSDAAEQADAVIASHRAKRSRRPSSTARRSEPGRVPRFSVSHVLSTVTTCDTTTPELCAIPAVPAGKRTLPGPSAKRRLN